MVQVILTIGIGTLADTFFDRAILNDHHVADRANSKVCRGTDQQAICTPRHVRRL